MHVWNCDHQVQRSIEDQSVLVATYEGEHNHTHPKVEASSGAPTRSSALGNVPSSPRITTLDHLTKPTVASSRGIGEGAHLQQFLVEQMASTLTKDPTFKAALADAISAGNFLQQNNHSQKWWERKRCISHIFVNWWRICWKQEFNSNTLKTCYEEQLISLTRVLRRSRPNPEEMKREKFIRIRMYNTRKAKTIKLWMPCFFDCSLTIYLNEAASWEQSCFFRGLFSLFYMNARSTSYKIHVRRWFDFLGLH